MEAWIFVLWFVPLAALIFVWTVRRARDVCERWARDNDFELEDARYCWAWRGPFFWRSSNSQIVFRITVRDREGLHRKGWLRCGSYFMGLWSDQAAVIWDQE